MAKTRIFKVIFASTLFAFGCGTGSGGSPGTGGTNGAGTAGTNGGGTAGTNGGGTAGTNGGGTAGTNGGGTAGTNGGGTAGTNGGGTAGTNGGGTAGTNGGGTAGTNGGGTAGTNGTAGTVGNGGRGGTTGTAGTVGNGGRGGTTGTAGTGGTTAGGVTVNLTGTHQTIQGFGINTALMPSGKTFPADKIFGTTAADSIGLSILRIGMNSDGSLTGQFISQAKAANSALKVIGSTWSPPASCKSNGSTQRGGSLLESCYGSWSDTIANFAMQQGLYAMSIGNESDFASCAAAGPPCTDDYDTTTYTAKQMVAFVKVAGPKLKAKGIKVIAPEASEWIHAWSNISATGSTVSTHPNSSDPLKCGCYGNAIIPDTACTQNCRDGNGYDYGHWLWADQTAWGAFDIFGVHEYDSQIAFAWPADVNGGVRNKEIWQTEMSGVRYWPEEGPNTTIQNGVAVAGWIHSALTVGEASAWLWWWYESYYQNDNEGLAIIQGSTTTAKRYFTLGNYSKFVRPGYIAVDVTGNSNANVLISAFKGTGSAIAIVAVNKSGSAVSVPITISGGTAPAMVTPYVTSSSLNLAGQPAVTVSGGTFTAALGATSVTTFVGQ